MVLLSLLIVAIQNYSVRDLGLSQVSDVYRINSSSVVTRTDDGWTQVYNFRGLPVGKKSKLPNGDILGFQSSGAAVIGREYSENNLAVSLTDGKSTVERGSPCWRTIYESGTYLQTNGGLLIATTESLMTSLDVVGWHDMYCLEPDGKCLVLIRGDFNEATIEYVEGVQSKSRLSHGKRVKLLTPSGSPLQAILPWTSSIAPLKYGAIVAFCRLSGFSSKEINAVPYTSVGPKHLVKEPDVGICAIDIRTGRGRLLATLKDWTEYGEGPSFNTPMERRHDLAVMNENQSFVAIFGGHALYCSPKIDKILD